jgi:type VI secretion system secreted protein Hcp
MAVTTYLRLNTDKLVKIKGGATQKGHEGDITVISLDHSITSPRDIATGQATGKRQHSPLSILKEADAATPLLNKMIVENILIKTAEFFFYGPAQQGRLSSSLAGQDKNVYTIILQNAFISKVEFAMQNNRETEGDFVPLKERISIVYEKIEWKWAEGGISALDEWKAPN